MQYSKRSAHSFEQTQSLRNARATCFASRLTAFGFSSPSSLGHGHGRAHSRSRARSSFEGSSAESRLVTFWVIGALGVAARSRRSSSRCRGSVHPLRDASSSIRSLSRSSDPFGCPSRSYPRSPHGVRGRLRLFHSGVLERGSFRSRLSTITIAPVRSPARWSRSRTVFLFSPFGAESPFCVHSRLSVHGSCSCSLHLAAFRARPRPCPLRDVRACFTTIHLAMNGMPASASASRCSLARLGLAHLLGVRARSTFVNNLGRSSPPAMFARLTALGHFRRRCSTRAAPTFLVHPRHLAMPSMPAFVIASRRSCSRSHACAASRRFRDCSRHTCGARVCASPLLPSLFRAPASVPPTFASLNAHVVCAVGCPRSACVVFDANVVLAFSVSAIAFVFRRSRPRSRSVSAVVPSPSKAVLISISRRT